MPIWWTAARGGALTNRLRNSSASRSLSTGRLSTPGPDRRLSAIMTFMSERASGDLFLPEPEPREVRYTVISVDDHLVEPADMFESRLPAALQDRAPRIVETKLGHQVWDFDGNRYSQVGMNAVAGRRPETVKVEPFRF